MKFVYSGSDAATWGVSAFYEDFEIALRDALTTGEAFDTGWRSVKKEIQSFRIERKGLFFGLFASCSDDFDTEGFGEAEVAVSGSVEVDLRAIQEGLDKAVEQAVSNQKDNSPVGLYCIGKKGSWTFTYLLDLIGLDQPPGDYYFRWGWQDVEVDDEGHATSEYPIELGADLAAKIEAKIYDADWDDQVEVEGWTIRCAS